MGIYIHFCSDGKTIHKADFCTGEGKKKKFLESIITKDDKPLTFKQFEKLRLVDIFGHKILDRNLKIITEN